MATVAALVAVMASETFPASAVTSVVDQAAASPASMSTPVFSIRRIPTVLARAAADGRLAADLDRALTDPVLGGAVANSCLEVVGPRASMPAQGQAASSGRTVYARRPDAPLIPASTMKLATASVALTRIGSTTRLSTEIRSSAVAADGSVGDLWLVGGGDPLLSTAGFAVDGGFGGQPRLSTSMEALADLVVGAGVRRVGGRVLGDDSRYDAERLVPSWNPRYLTDFEVSPMSALVVDKGFVVRAPAKPVLATSPAAHAATVLATLLVERGVAVDGGAGEGKAPAEVGMLTRIESPPLREVVGEVLQNSDNLGAEMLLKEIGLRVAGAGSTASGLDVLRADLAAMGVDLDGVITADGSGLARSGRLTCTALGDLLDRNGDGGELDSALPVAGRNGTLYRRFVGTPAAGKVRAKTGGLEGVVALAGWVSAREGGSMRFALLLNDLPRSSLGTAAQDKVVSALATYPSGPGAAELGPTVFAPPAVGG